MVYVEKMLGRTTILFDNCMNHKFLGVKNITKLCKSLKIENL